MRKKLRLLFLAYYFPPINMIGAVRAYNMAKWLTRKGWEVTVVSPRESLWGGSRGATDPELEGIRCIRTEHRWRLLSALLKQPQDLMTQTIGGLCRRIAPILGIERETGWIADAAKACAGLTPADVDVILATGPPFASFDLARRLAQRLGRPYVVDYRDLWTGNPYAEGSTQRRTIDKERTVLAASAAAIGVSPGLTQSLQDQFGRPKRSYVISNGFDPEELARTPKNHFGHFAIVYTGTFYPPKSAIQPLMAALQQVDRIDVHRSPWAFHYYGHKSSYVWRAAEDFGLAHRVVIHGSVSRQEALAAVRGANVAVVISSIYERASLQDRGVVTGKVFEAIGCGTPLLVIAPQGSDLEGILAVTGLGKRFAGTEIDRIAAFLHDAMNDGTPRRINPDPFNWATIVERLDGILREVVDAQH